MIRLTGFGCTGLPAAPMRERRRGAVPLTMTTSR